MHYNLLVERTKGEIMKVEKREEATTTETVTDKHRDRDKKRRE